MTIIRKCWLTHLTLAIFYLKSLSLVCNTNLVDVALIEKSTNMLSCCHNQFIFSTPKLIDNYFRKQLIITLLIAHIIIINTNHSHYARLNNDRSSDHLVHVIEGLQYFSSHNIHHHINPYICMSDINNNTVVPFQGRCLERVSHALSKINMTI